MKWAMSIDGVTWPDAGYWATTTPTTERQRLQSGDVYHDSSFSFVPKCHVHAPEHWRVSAALVSRRRGDVTCKTGFIIFSKTLYTVESPLPFPIAPRREHSSHAVAYRLSSSVLQQWTFGGWKVGQRIKTRLTQAYISCFPPDCLLLNIELPLPKPFFILSRLQTSKITTCIAIR